MYRVAYISFGVTLCELYRGEQEFISVFYGLIAIELPLHLNF